MYLKHYTPGIKLRSHKYNLLFLSALAANNKMDLVTKVVIFVAVFFLNLKLKSTELLYAAAKTNRSKCTTGK